MEVSFAVERFTEKVIISLVDKTGEGLWNYCLTMKEVKDWTPGGMVILNLIDEDGKLIHSGVFPIDKRDGVSVEFEITIGFEDEETRIIGFVYEPNVERYHIHVV